MKITEVRIRIPQNLPENVLAFASVCLDDELVVHGLAVVQGERGAFVSMPSKPPRAHGGERLDIVHPANREFRKYLEEEVISAYELKLQEEPV